MTRKSLHLLICAAVAVTMLVPTAAAKSKESTATLSGSSVWHDAGPNSFSASGSFSGAGTLRGGTYTGTFTVEAEVLHPGAPGTHCHDFGCRAVSGTFELAAPGGTLTATIDSSTSYAHYPYFGRAAGVVTQLTLVVTAATGKFRSALGRTLTMDYATISTYTCPDEETGSALCPISDLGTLSGKI